MSYDLYAWKVPRDVDADAAAALFAAWFDAGGDPASSPFEPSGDVGWFHRELVRDAPAIDVTSDAVPSDSRLPVWLQTDSAPPARLVWMRLPPGTGLDALEAIFGLATKYDLVVFDPQTHSVHRPLDELAAEATRSFWPRGAVQAMVAGAAGAVAAAGAWILGIPIVSGAIALAGGFMVLMAAYTFFHEGRNLLRLRRPPRP
jgi:hypothetical protein